MVFFVVFFGRAPRSSTRGVADTQNLIVVFFVSPSLPSLDNSFTVANMAISLLLTTISAWWQPYAVCYPTRTSVLPDTLRSLPAKSVNFSLFLSLFFASQQSSVYLMQLIKILPDVSFSAFKAKGSTVDQGEIRGNLPYMRIISSKN